VRDLPLFSEESLGRVREFLSLLLDGDAVACSGMQWHDGDVVAW